MRKLQKLVVAAAVATVVGLASAEPVDSYNGLVSAINGAAAGSTIKLKAGATITVGAQVNVNKALTISGGWIDDETSGGAKTILSGGGTKDIVAARAADIEFENIKFTATGAYAIYRDPNLGGFLNIRHCDFIDNVCNATRGGIAIYANGTASATLTVEDCVFDNNATTSTADGGNDLHGHSPVPGNKTFGVTIRVADFQRATFTRCSFTRCGVNSDHAVSGRVGFGDWDQIWGSVLGAYHTPITLSECSFRANRGATPRNNNGGGGIVYIAGKCGGSTVKNCLFVGNEELCTATNSVGPNGWAQFNAGALVINLETASLSAEVDGCTFAYNLSETSRSAAGLSVQKGAVTVKNSVFYGNRRATNGVGGADLTINSDASATVTYSVFTDNTTASVANQTGAAVTLGVGIKYGDPLFRSPLSDFTALVSENTSTHYLDPTRIDDVLALDVHLKSTQGTYANGEWVTYDVDSPAIDAGDPMAPFVDEPLPNGDRLNAGVYGNTDEASKSESGEIILPTIDSATISFPGGYTHPRANVLLGCDDPDADYDAAVTITLTTGGVVIASQTIPGQHPGDVVTLLAPVYPQPGTEVTMAVSVAVAGADPVTCDPVVEPATGVLPPWYGKGGPANVIHVRAGADGLGTGENWTDAFANIPAALAALSGDKDEIWIAGDHTLTGAPSDLAPSTPVVIRGGFTGVENAATDRAEGVISTLSGGGQVDLVSVNNAAGKTVTFEDLEFREGTKHAVEKKKSAGDVVFRRCVFADNSSATERGCGQALAGDGASKAASLTLEDCVFRRNQNTNKTTDPGGDGGPRIDNNVYAYGIAVRLISFARVTIERCTFEENGIPFDHRLYGGSTTTGQGLGFWNPVYGSTMFINDSRVTMRGCVVRANRGSTPRAAYGGGVIYVNYALDGTEIRNCLFVGNEELGSTISEVTPENYAQWCGALVLAPTANCTATVQNCTFAYNLSETSRGAGALSVRQPDLGSGVGRSAVGTVVVRDSVFYGNQRGKNGIGGADLAAADEATVDVAYSYFTDANAVTGADELDNVSYGDPLFVTPLVEVTPLIVPETATATFYYDFNIPGALDAVKAFDVHLKSRTGTYVDGAWTAFDVSSPAIDAGDPASSCANEPKPNGHRVNMGAYGNTAYASLSKRIGFLLLLK